MLSELISSKEAYFNIRTRFLTIKHTQQPLIIDEVPKAHRHYRVVTFNYCSLRSLEGIEQFEDIEELNLKFNNIEDVEELERIRNKDKIVKLDFSGNQIEYLGGGLFINLRKIFPNLIDLNGKDYTSLLYSKKNKKYDMKKILSKAQKIQKQLTKTIKANVTQTKYKPIETPSYEQIQQTTFKNKATIPICHGSEDEYDYEDNYNKDMQQTSRHQEEPEYEECNTGLKENMNFNNVNYDRDISLGGLSNIPMTKSMRASMISQCPQKKKGLEIVTLNESLQAQQYQLAQPTATFAVQRQKQNAIMFRNRNGGRYSEEDRIFEQEYLMNSKDEEYRPTKRETYESDRHAQSLDDSQFMDGFVSRSIIANHRERMLVIDHLIQAKNQELKAKVFGSFKRLVKNKNLPMQLYLNDF